MFKQHHIKWVKRITAVLVVLFLAAVGTAWMMFQHIPHWYHPTRIPPEYEQAVKDNFVATLDSLKPDPLLPEQSFECRFSQDQINAWLAKRDELWEYFYRESRKWLPPFLADPQVAIDSDGFRVAVTYRYGDLRTVLSAKFQAQLATDSIMIRLVDVAAGSLPIPLSQIEPMLAKIDTTDWNLQTQQAKQTQNRTPPGLTGILEGIYIPDSWTWKDTQQTIRITRLTFEPGELIVTFDPLPRREAVRFKSWAYPD